MKDGYADSATRRVQVRQYIRENPGCTSRDIRRATKVKMYRVYDDLIEAYWDAHVPIPDRLLRRTRAQQRYDVIQYIRANPQSRVTEIQKATGVGVPRVFGSIVDAFLAAGVPYAEPPRTTGVMNRSVLLEAWLFEQDVLDMFECLGTLWRQVRCDAGVADGLLEIHGECFVIEIKHYTSYGNITKHDIKQLRAYMDALECPNGIIVCPRISLPKRVNSRDILKKGRRILICTPNDFRGRSFNLAKASGSSCLER